MAITGNDSLFLSNKYDYYDTFARKIVTCEGRKMRLAEEGTVRSWFKVIVGRMFTNLNNGLIEGNKTIGCFCIKKEIKIFHLIILFKF